MTWNDPFTSVIKPNILQTVSTFDFHNLSHLAFSAAPNPPTLTVIPLYSASGGLLEIESQATEGVRKLGGSVIMYLSVGNLQFAIKGLLDEWTVVLVVSQTDRCSTV